ncbi:MAG: HNH endonuclease [Bacilli bacterium]
MSKNNAKNQKMKRKLQTIYGKGCFFERAHIAERIEAMGGIKTFRIFVEEKRYKGKAISYQLTVHHLKHISEGGETTEENCAVIAEIAHQYAHSLPRDDEEKINDMLREFKINIIAMRGNREILDSTSIEPTTAAEYLVIPLYDNTPEQNAFIEEKRKEKQKSEKYQRLKNPTRAMKKRELQQLIDEEYEI